MWVGLGCNTFIVCKILANNLSLKFKVFAVYIYIYHTHIDIYSLY